MSKGKFALGAVVGTAIGVVAGWLTATKSGQETRTELKTKAEALKAEACKKADEVKTEAKDIASDLEAKAKDIVDDTMEEVDDLKARTERAVKGAKKGFFDKK